MQITLPRVIINPGGNMEKTILITTKDDKAGISISPNTSLSDAIQLLGTLTLHILNAYTDVILKEVNQTTNTSAKEKHAAITGIKESMYDAMNNMLSTALNTYYPEHPTLQLEEEAILELTNKLIEDRYNALPKSQKVLYDRAKQKAKLALGLSKNAKSTNDDTTGNQSS